MNKKKLETKIHRLAWRMIIHLDEHIEYISKERDESLKKNDMKNVYLLDKKLEKIEQERKYLYGIL